jgi:hypothetical protein
MWPTEIGRPSRRRKKAVPKRKSKPAKLRALIMREPLLNHDDDVRRLPPVRLWRPHPSDETT